MRTAKTQSITLAPETLTRASELAKRENRTISEMVSVALRQYESQRWWDQTTAQPPRLPVPGPKRT
jgi:predicted transcriptional regulator